MATLQLRDVPFAAASESSRSSGPSGRAASPAELAAILLALVKVRVSGLVVFTGVVAAVVAGRGATPPGVLALFALAGFLGAAGAAVLNHYLDRDVDGSMERTRQRPLPARQVSPATALLLGVALLGASLALAATISPSLPRHIAVAALVYVGLYTGWLKRRTPYGVVVGSWTASAAVLGGWEVTGQGITASAVGLAAVVFLWTPPHFWALALARGDDFRRIGLPTLPAVAGERHTIRWIALGVALTVGTSLVPWLDGALGPLYALAAVAAGTAFLWAVSRLASQPTRQHAWTAYKLSGVYLLVLFLAMLLDLSLFPGGPVA